MVGTRVGRLTDLEICMSAFQGAFDKPSIRRLATAWAFAARSPRTIVYLPITRPRGGGERPSGPDDDGERLLGPDDGRVDLDLVLVHHSLQLRRSSWPEIRRRLGPGRAEALRPAPSAVRLPERRPWWDDADPVRCDVRARTLFVAGSRAGFSADLPSLRYLVEEAPAEHSRHPRWHQCAEIADDQIHIEYASRRAPR